MTPIRRPLAVAALSTALALSGAGAAFACGDSGGNQPGSYDNSAGSYDGATSTTSSDSTTATSASKQHVRKHGKRHSRRA
jgi:hypothetical protein